MRICVLSENTAVSEALAAEHGLSLYVETERHRLLFDTGAGGNFAKNAVKLGIDLRAVDIAFISHGHYDHGGGLKTFLNLNTKAPVYISKNAFGRYYANRTGGVKQYIGLDEELVLSERFICVEEGLVIDEEFELFSGVKGNSFIPSGNADLFEFDGQNYKQDDFTHEQSLIITQGNKKLLIAGCAHRGIINILDKFKELQGRCPDYVIGGFHLYSLSTDSYEPYDRLVQIGELLKASGSVFFTCHCTGIKAYRQLKEIMPDKMNYISAGDNLVI